MRVLARNGPPTAMAPQDAAQALLRSGGGLDAWPGPALLLQADGTVCAANEAAGVLIHPAPDPRLVEGAAAGKPQTFTLTCGDGAARRCFDCTVLPLGDGGPALVLAHDATLDGRLRDALVESRQRYKDLVEASGDFAWETGDDGRFVFVSPQGAVGWRAEELVGEDPAAFAAEHPLAAGTLPFHARDRAQEVDLWFRRRGGGAACLAVTALPLHARDGRWIGARGLCRDVTEARARDHAIARASMRERLLAHVARAIRDELEPARIVAAAEQAAARALDAIACRIIVGPDAAPAAGPAEAGGRRVLAVPTLFRGIPNGALVIERAAKDPAWSDDDRALASDFATQIGIALAQIERERRLEALSRTDPLTGLLNRRAFDAELAERLDRAGLPAAAGALVLVDLDNFKAVNDLGGHGRGDEALRAGARLLSHSTRPGDLVARLGGDEFALWLERTDAPAAARRAAELVRAAGSLAAYSGEPARPFGFSVGVAVFAPGSGETPAGLVQRADTAMYRVKRDGKGGFAIAPPFAPSIAVAPP